MKRQLKLAAQLRACRLLAELLAAGFSFNDGLRYLQVAMPANTRQWAHLQQVLAAGGGLAQALQEVGFHPLIVSQVQLAELHGRLAASLQQAADYLQLQAQNRRRLQQLMVYPAVLLSLLVIVQLVLWFAVLPSLMIAPSQTWRWQLLGLAAIGIVSAGALLVYAKASWHLRFALSRLVPGIRGLVMLYYQYQFVAGASHYLAAGLELSAYCQRLAKQPPSVLQHLGRQITQALADGQELTVAMQQKLVYPPLSELLALGQSEAIVRTGAKLFAQSLFAELQARYQRLLNLVQPVMFLLIGVQIVMVYMDILGPLYNSVRS
ncbi:type II secretion system F family protein [Lacticaseibacillus jixiensis]|uniref:type II secretion system F family protein n=1 Tax=Lacticaseibacillus jixiensis TaxID=3231926 RepID=UPI0036F1DF3E